MEKERWKKVEKEGEVDDEKQFRGEIRNLLLLPLGASSCLAALTRVAADDDDEEEEDC